LSGTPTGAGTTSSVLIIVTDGATSTSLPTFSIAVAAAVANTAPTIIGTPVKTARVGSPYTFTPTAGDAERDTLTFLIANKPTWASFNAATGQLSGTPAAAGTASDILIRVSDGRAVSSLAGFSIVISPDSMPGTVTVNWSVPTQNSDGSSIENLAGYRVRYGKSADSLTTMVTVGNAGIVNSTIQGLTPGVWYFSVTAFTSDGAESDDSTVVSATVT
jgi:hypothetical protein